MEFLRSYFKGHLRLAGILTGLLFAGCSPTDTNPQDQEAACLKPIGTAIAFQELSPLYQGELTLIRDEIVLEGVVVSSDQEGNIFGSLYLQDREENPTSGLEIRTDLLDIYTRFPPGSRIQIALQGTFLDKSRGGWSLGSKREIFGNPTLDRLPALETLERMSLVCPLEPRPLVAKTVSLAELAESDIHTLVRIPGVEVQQSYTNRMYAEAESETLVPLEDCSGTGISLVNSGYSDFHMLPLPEGSGTATGILLSAGQDPELLLRSAEDLAFNDPSCDELFPPVRSDQILISELADPDNEAAARFIELYNAGNELVELKGWTLVRYTNGNQEAGGIASLDGHRIASGETLVFTANPEVFEGTYGRSPDGVFRANGPADSNGDDNIVLVNPYDEIVDVFGVPGVDGSGTAHEFEDGRALRRPEVIEASGVFNPSEWMIYNDTGKEGTTQMPMTAPEDYTPGSHPDSESSS